MKKLLLLISALSLTVFTGCGKKNTENNNNNNNNSTVDSSIVTETDTKTNKIELTSEPEESDTDETGIYFKNNTARLDDLKIKITNTKVIKVGEPGNEYGNKPVLAIWHEITNLGDEQTTAVKAWAKIFTATQNTSSDLDSVKELRVGYNPEYDYLDTEMEIIKKGDKVKNAIAYELNDLETPVTLIARNGLNGDIIGEQIFDIKELAK